MVFNSFKFVYFFLAVISLYFFIPFRAKKYFLLVASYLFYMSWKVEYGLLLLLSTLINYYAAIEIEKNRFRPLVKKRVLLFSILLNVGMLIGFKYLDFLGSHWASLAQLLGWEYSWTMQHILLPVGISFFTFQALSYTVDVYRKEIPAEKNFVYYALYHSFFPQLVAGPIERAANLLPQFKVERRADTAALLSGGRQMLLGFFKKMVVADNLAVFVDKVYDPAYPATGVEYILATYAFLFQLYGDFSGYSDIALGSARMMGFDLMENFRRPFLATSISDFWQRWHRSLYAWVRDYIYIPLGGNRRGRWQTYRNRFSAMLLMGIWHGANTTMLVFGAINGLSVVLDAAFKEVRTTRWHLPGKKLWSIVLTFHAICIPFVYFRSRSIEQGNYILKTIVSSSTWATLAQRTIPESLPVIGTAFALILLLSDCVEEYWPADRLQKIRRWGRPVYDNLLLYAVLLFGVFKASQFIYFQF